MPLTINFNNPCKNFMNFKVFFSFFLYVTCLLVYYFVGIKSDDPERKKYNDLPIFITIILYIYKSLCQWLPLPWSTLLQIKKKKAIVK